MLDRDPKRVEKKTQKIKQPANLPLSSPDLPRLYYIINHTSQNPKMKRKRNENPTTQTLPPI
jgi:hypothetical protein